MKRKKKQNSEINIRVLSFLFYIEICCSLLNKAINERKI